MRRKVAMVLGSRLGERKVRYGLSLGLRSEFRYGRTWIVDNEKQANWYNKVVQGIRFKTRFERNLNAAQIQKDENLQKTGGWEYYLKQAESGDVLAQKQVAECYFFGQLVEKNVSEALKWYTAAAEQGDLQSQEWLGFYHSISSSESNQSEANKWLTKAAAKSARAQILLGDRYLTGEGSTEKNPQTALSWYLKAAEQGDSVEAAIKLADLYIQGEGFPKDWTKAKNWLLRVGPRQPAGYIILGDLYQIGGNGLKKNYFESFNNYERAAEAGSSDGMYNIGVMFLKGQGVDKNAEHAFKWFEKAANKGNKAAQSNLGYMYEHGVGIGKDTDQSNIWYNKAKKVAPMDPSLFEEKK
eukprot:TRINITY_DN4783_c0_g1_i1.p1 TRINITY_DN4783_c0_g1~~TRINITY_DN4783_c0_g1_i1.p1  ORF type:complete len:355 (+),score=81.67 TRINITY_DN4783_c0_g1_i1:1-1065(+)